ncbi:MAG TPA: hypothetical protein VEQ11_10350 [Chloroflexota bacterium]|nr:hypothetical protein [Chloroflexota bacterium]
MPVERPPATPSPLPAAPPPPTPLAAPAPPAPAEPPRPTPTPLEAVAVNKRGVHLLLDDGGNRWPEEVWDQHLAWAAKLAGHGGYVVQLIRSNDLRPEVWQPYFDSVAREGLVPIVRLATYKDLPHQWWVAPEPDPGEKSYRSEADRFRRFFDAIVWRAERVVVTIGNEPNRPDEWGGAADPAAYARYLRDVAQAMRRVSSVRPVVLNAALDGFAPSRDGPGGASFDAERFLQGMLAEVPDCLELVDGWAAHAYPLGPFGEPPGRQEFRIDDVRPEATPRSAPAPGLPNRGVNSYAWELWKLGQLGLGRELPVYITETGWRHVQSQVAASLDVSGATVEDERFADYVSLAFDGPGIGWTPWNVDPRVKAVALFALAGKPDEWGHTNLALVDSGGRIVGAYQSAERLAVVRPGPVARRGLDVDGGR